jgi:hypothetical protein
VSDASDAQAEAEAGPAPLTIDKYQHAQSVAWCTRAAECCALGAQFDFDRCVNFWDQNFGPDNLAAYLQTYSGNFAGLHAVFDVNQANECINLIRNKNCTQTGADKRNIYAVCQTAVQGSLGTNVAGCKTALECTAGNYCDASGTCKALQGSGGTCTDPNYNGDECSYLGITTDANSLHCSTLGGTGTCVAGLGAGSVCSAVDQVCASGICSSVNNACVTSSPLGGAYCTQFTKPADGGN